MIATTKKTTRSINIGGSYYYCLSNFSAHRIWFEKRFYHTSEHLYQSVKFLSSEKSGARNAWVKVRKANSAFLAKKYAHENRESYREEWRVLNFKIGVMHQILLLKVKQHDEVREALYTTRDKDIIELSYSDSFWGQTHTGKGENWLGRLWMQIRNEIRTSL